MVLDLTNKKAPAHRCAGAIESLLIFFTRDLRRSRCRPLILLLQNRCI